MSKLLAFVGWLKAHKARVAWIVLFLSGGFEAVGLDMVSTPLAAAALWLHGAGSAASDREVKANQ